MQTHKKLDQRGYNSESTRAKKTAGGRKVRDRSRKDPRLQERINAVVAAAAEAGSVRLIPGRDVVGQVLPLFTNHRVRGCKVG